jgi:hypothetical protein
MESVWLLLGRRLVQSIRLGFLGAWPFRCESPADEGWIFLDFLGCSRPNLDFSMGYTAFSAENFSRALLRGARPAGTGACGRGHAEAQDCSWGKLNLISDFLQEIVRLNQT